MSICPNCGAPNQIGIANCVRCGVSLSETKESGSAVRGQQPTSISIPSGVSQKPTTFPQEEIPDWLEILLARYGEPIPTFEDVSVEVVSSAAPTEPLATPHLASGAPEPPRSESEDAELLGEVERLKRSLVEEQPATKEISGAADLPIKTPAASREVDDWLAELRALQANVASESVSGSIPVGPSAEEALQGVLPSEPVDNAAQLERPEAATEETPSIPTEASLGPTELSESVTTSTSEEESVPEWLRELGLVSSEQLVSPPSVEPGQTSETLGTLPMAEKGISEVSGATPSDEEIPDWLKRLIAISSQVPEAASTGEAARSEESGTGGELEELSSAEGATSGESLPDWLRELQTMETTQLDAAAPPEERKAAERVPEERELPSAPEAATSVPTIVEGISSVAAAEAKIPTSEEGPPAEWLAELEELIEHPPAEQMSPPPAEEEVPDWLRELAAERPEEEPEVQVPVEQQKTPPLEPAELPEWLAQLHPGEGGSEAVPAQTAAVFPESQHLASGEDVIGTLRARLGVPQVPDVEGATLFREIVSEPPEMTAVPVPEEVEAAPRRNILTTVIWALVFVAILLGIAILSLALLDYVRDLLGETAFQRFLNTPAAAGLVASLEEFREPIVAVQQNDIVLLSIEYTPATEAEMQPLARVVLHDLLGHGARVLTVSQQPEGPALAQRLLDEASATYPYGERTLNLGYLPGEAVGVRSLERLQGRQVYASPNRMCHTLGECPTWRDVRGIEDVKLFVIVADCAEPVRWWIEQLPTMFLGNRPMIAAVSAVALPTLRPYLISASAARTRLEGLIGGVTAAAAYEIYTGEPGRALGMMAAQSAAHLGLFVVALAGIFAGIRAGTGRQ